MNASKAKERTKRKSSKRAPKADENARRKTVTFRMDDEDRQLLTEHALRLASTLHKRISNNEAIRYMIRSAVIGADPKLVATTLPQKPVTFRLDEDDKQQLTEFVIKLSSKLHRRVPNNDAIRFMIRSAKVAAKAKGAAA